MGSSEYNCWHYLHCTAKTSKKVASISYTPCVITLLSDSLPLLVILKHRFLRFINKAIDHSSPIISCVGNVSIRNALPICNASYHHFLNECNNKYEMSAREI